jgi:hypothetical protein
MAGVCRPRAAAELVRALPAKFDTATSFSAAAAHQGDGESTTCIVSKVVLCRTPAVARLHNDVVPMSCNAGYTRGQGREDAAGGSTRIADLRFLDARAAGDVWALWH